MPVEAPTAHHQATLDKVQIIVGVFCAQNDPALVSGADAAVAVQELATSIRQLTAKQAQFAARVEACHSHGRRFASSDEFLARVNGTSRGEAKKVIDTARRLSRAPGAASEAFERGELSVGEADAISSAAALDPSAEDDLVAKATETHDLAETRERADKVRAAARRGEDPDARRARLRALRRWREFDRDGMREVMGRFVPEEWARVAPVIEAYLDAQFTQARREGRREPIEAYRADAVLAALAAAGEAAGLLPASKPETATGAEPATTATAAGTEPTETETAATPAESSDAESELERLLGVRPGRFKWNVSILVDAIALKRGYATATETCEIVGVGPVDVAWISRILPEAMVDVLVHDLVDIRAHATMTRHRKKAIDQALRARDRRCVVPGCRRRGRLQADHRHDYAQGGPTSGANLELLCEIHHADKTYRGARLERSSTEWLWYPPPPAAGEPQPPPGTIPWRGPIGEHLTAFDLTDLPPPDDTEPDRGDEANGTLPFG